MHVTNRKIRIGEKLLEWPDQREPLPLDTILAMVSLYWFTDTFSRSLYHAQVIQTVLKGDALPISKEKPLGYSMFPRDLVVLPEAWAHHLYPNLVFFKAHDIVSCWSPLCLDGKSLTEVNRADISRDWSSQSYSYKMSRSLLNEFAGFSHVHEYMSRCREGVSYESRDLPGADLESN